MSLKFSRAVAACTAIACCVIAPIGHSAIVEQTRAGLSSTTPRPALFERNAGQYANDIAYRASFTRVNAAIHVDGSFSAYAHPGAATGYSPVRFELQQANANAGVRTEQPHAYRTNYLYGGKEPRQVRDVPHFQRVQFDDVYPHIALAYYPVDGKLEYDFIVEPEGDVAKISWRVSGAKSLAVNQNGDLVIATASGDYLQRRPLAYQTINAQKRAIDVAYRFAANGDVGFAVGEYDKSATLVIDPIIEYASYLGGASDDSPHAVTIGPDGFIYISGITRSSDFPTANAFSSRLGGASDAFVTKINPTTGALVYSTYLGDARNPDDGMGLVVDNAGSVYVTGLAGTKFPTTSGAYVATSSAKSGFLTLLSG